MERLLLTSDLRAQGYGSSEVARMVREGRLAHVRRGVYVVPAQPGPRSDEHGIAAHKLLVTAAVRQRRTDVIVSHASAAALHGLPTWASELETVHLTRNRPGRGRTRGHVRVYGIPYAEEDVVHVDGLPTTSVARTVVDLACQQPLIRSVPVGDAALREGGPELSAAIARQLAAAIGRTGVPRARQAIAMLDPSSESVGESYSRVRFVEAGVPTPVLQYDVWSRDGDFLGRSDFAWPELGTLGEFDGIVKYSGRFGQTTQGALVAEKRREDRIRDEGWQVVRWTWDELAEPAPLIARLERAFARGRRAA